MAEQSPIDGLRVLVVEDEALVGLDLEHMLSNLGCSVIREYHPGIEVRSLKGAGAVDVAVLDINLGNATSYPIADALMKQGTPFIFVTGYNAVDARYRHAPLIEEPFDAEELVAAIQQAMQNARRD
jgi:CheY-like chemotaxis protein